MMRFRIVTIPSHLDYIRTGAMMVGMRLSGTARWMAIFLVATFLVATGMGCRRQVQAPLTAVAPVPGMPFLVPVDLSNPEQHPGPRPMPTAEEAVRGHKAVKVSPEIVAAMLQRRPVNRAYPPEVQERHLHGNVTFRAILAEDGTVKALTVLAATDPAFVPAATETVQRCQYRPYLLNGKPVLVDTTITVNFDESPYEGIRLP